MFTLTSEQRTLRARVAAFSKHAKHDPNEAMARARAAVWHKYEQQVDPGEILDPEERHRRARTAMQADLARRALQAAKARAEEADHALADEFLASGAP